MSVERCAHVLITILKDERFRFSIVSYSRSLGVVSNLKALCVVKKIGNVL